MWAEQVLVNAAVLLTSLWTVWECVGVFYRKVVKKTYNKKLAKLPI